LGDIDMDDVYDVEKSDLVFIGAFGMIDKLRKGVQIAV
jgi:magnesium-transporting ATPase (P-type)